LEHIINYKNPTPTPEVVDHFRAIADILNSFDESTISLKEAANVWPAVVDSEKN
jgi:hypothetical protein